MNSKFLVIFLSFLKLKVLSRLATGEAAHIDQLSVISYQFCYLSGFVSLMIKGKFGQPSVCLKILWTLLYANLFFALYIFINSFNSIQDG